MRGYNRRPRVWPALIATSLVAALTFHNAIEADFTFDGMGVSTAREPKVDAVNPKSPEQRKPC